MQGWEHSFNYYLQRFIHCHYNLLVINFSHGEINDEFLLLMDAWVKSRDTLTPCLHATWEATVDI